MTDLKMQSIKGEHTRERLKQERALVPIRGLVSAPLKFPSSNDTRWVGTGATLMPLSSQFCSVWHFYMAPVTNYPSLSNTPAEKPRGL